MHEGVEVRGNSLRVYFRYQGELCREPFPGDASPANIEQASRLAGLIRHEIKHGTFSYARHFPNSVKVKTNTFGHFIDLWLNIKRNGVAPSGFRVYEGRAEMHIRPKWGPLQADQIDHLDLQEWVQTELMPKLHNKTVNEIIGLVRQIFRLYRMRNRQAHDPTEGLRVRVPDRDDPDPFDRREIEAILSLETKRDQERNLAQFMIWAGPRVSEAISLAWEDVVDLDKGIVRFQRSQVRGHYKVTKTRRSVREVKLLKPAREALQAQAKLTRDLKPVEVEVTERDNKTKRLQPAAFRVPQLQHQRCAYQFGHAVEGLVAAAPESRQRALSWAEQLPAHLRQPAAHHRRGAPGMDRGSDGAHVHRHDPQALRQVDQRRRPGHGRHPRARAEALIPTEPAEAACEPPFFMPSHRLPTMPCSQNVPKRVSGTGEGL